MYDLSKKVIILVTKLFILIYVSTYIRFILQTPWDEITSEITKTLVVSTLMCFNGIFLNIIMIKFLLDVTFNT